MAVVNTVTMTADRMRTVMALVAISLGVTAIMVAGGFIQDIYAEFAEALIHSHYGHVQIYRAGYSAHGTQRPSEYIIDDPQPLLDRLSAVPEVSLVLPRAEENPEKSEAQWEDPREEGRNARTADVAHRRPDGPAWRGPPGVPIPVWAQKPDLQLASSKSVTDASGGQCRGRP